MNRPPFNNSKKKYFEKDKEDVPLGIPFPKSIHERKLSLEEFRKKAADFRKEVGPQKTNSADLIREDREINKF